MISSPCRVRALDRALAAAGPYRITGAYLGHVDGDALGSLEVSLIIKGERLQSWDFALDGSPARKRTPKGVVGAVSAALKTICD